MDLHQEIDNIAEDFAIMTVHQAGENVVLPIELTNTTGTCLQHLNTHCLMKIFSSSSLTLTDLCSIAETCTRFKEIAEQIFPKDLIVGYNNNQYCTYTFCLSSKKYGDYWTTMPPVERILKNFGQYISVVAMRNCDELVKPLAKYCGTATLQRLHIGGFDSGQGEGLTWKLKSIFQRVLALSFYHCDLMTLIPCPYINCDSLMELEIAHSSGCGTILRNTFPKLERFTFFWNSMFSKPCYQLYDNDDEYCSEILPNFLRRHKLLTTLHLSSESVCCSSQLMETIANNCTELTNLTLQRWRSPKTSFNFSNLKNLHKLNMLDVRLDRIDHRQISALLKVLKSLTTLKLSCMSRLEHGFQLLSDPHQLPNLRELHLGHGHFDQIPWSSLTQLKAVYLRSWFSEFSASHLLQIIRKLTNLEEIVCHGVGGNGVLLSSEIVKVVERRPNKLTLTCYLSENLKKNYVPNKNVNLIEYEHTDSD